jgi:CheY-like chemotaxis protein
MGAHFTLLFDRNRLKIPLNTYAIASMNNLPVSSNPSNVPKRSAPPLVLVVEDSDEDYEALRRSFRQSSVQTQLHRCETGKQALEYLEQCILAKQAYPTSIPSFILLDLNLPGIDGRRILQTIKEDPRLQFIPVIVLTTSTYAKDIEECYRLGANSYLLKAMDVQRFKESIQVLIQYWLNTITLP